MVKKGRRLSPKEKQALQDEVDKMLKAKVIRPSNSPWSSPPILVPKPDGSMRLCNNYRGINAVTKKDKYPLPRMDDIIDKLSGAQWFSSIDLKSGYWQIPVAEQDKCKTAFSTPSGLYEYNVMPFGLTNAPATFARFMAQILGTFPNAIVYLDDVLIFSPTKEAHKEHVFEVLRILNQWNLKLNLAKCKFFQQEAAFLGFIVTRNGLKSNPAKVDPIRTWPRPSSSAELQSFLGLSAPLYRLLKKNVPWSWKKLEEDAFQALKSALISLPELSYPDSNLPYALHCDASDTGVGAVLVQGGRPVAYASKSLTPAQRNYSTTERECLAVAWALQYFHYYVHGCPSLTVYTDHAALKAILSTKEPKGRIARKVLIIKMLMP
ncbi:hypothetical protein G6F37_013186 [Rhizopus arrhizus]|nr:hypothetical protein G6F37_013186 [Rhizopus arrhizus]